MKNWIGLKIWQYTEKDSFIDYDYLLNLKKKLNSQNESYLSSQLKSFSHGTHFAKYSSPYLSQNFHLHRVVKRLSDLLQKTEGGLKFRKSARLYERP
jgi:hypothetical protein